MKYFDPNAEENFKWYSLLATAMNDETYRYLMKESEEYRNLHEENDVLSNEYNFISKVIDHNLIDPREYTSEEVKALSDYITNLQQIDNVERMEIYWRGMHDCLQLLSFIKMI